MRRKAKGFLSRHKEAKGAAGSFPRPRFFANPTFQGFLGILVPYGLGFTLQTFVEVTMIQVKYTVH